MSKKDYFCIEKNINKITNNKYTNFLDRGTLSKVVSKLKGYHYQIYYPYKESDKVILYTKEIPKIRLLEIISYDKLSHRQILGSLFGLNIDSELFGDIIIDNNHYYIMVIDSIYDLIIKDYNMVGSSYIKLKEVPLSTINNYHRKYEEIEIIVSSTRIDTVISHLIGVSRDSVKKIFQDNDIILNYEVLSKINYNLNTSDIFSIRKYGKYKYGGIIKTSKKDNYIIKLYKYIDN